MDRAELRERLADALEIYGVRAGGVETCGDCGRTRGEEHHGWCVCGKSMKRVLAVVERLNAGATAGEGD